ncbi:MAG: EamA family transporter RarD [Halieaceae bacterium]|nr:EamA family transporter RarD [Halieaceae bacterium]
MTGVVSERQRGIALALVANAIWGGAALYWIQTQPVAPIDVLAHRGLWTLPAVLLILLFMGRLRGALALIFDWKIMRLMALAAALISINWGTFLWAVTSGHATEASLGYFLLPLLQVVIGVLFFKEQLSGMQIFAVAMAVLGIGIKVFEVGSLPIVALALSLSFAIYGAVRKFVRADSVQGLFLESLFLLPVAATWVLWHDGAGFGRYGLRVDFVLVFSGLFTAMPLLTSVAASRLLPLSTMGMLTYIGPTLQLVVALTFLGEQITAATAAAFACVWIGLLVVTADNLRKLHRMRRQRTSATEAL